MLRLSDIARLIGADLPPGTDRNIQRIVGLAEATPVIELSRGLLNGGIERMPGMARGRERCGDWKARRRLPFIDQFGIVQGVTNVPSSFINASIVTLFNELSEERVVSYLILAEVNTQIASMIRRCIENNRVANRAA